jgi:hypothetical protein
LDKVGKSRSLIFSTFELTSSFWQQSLQEKSRQYTAFSVPGKGARYQWRVTPMGLQGSPALFTRLMDFVMMGVKGIITYIDDILVHSRDHEQHLKTIEEVLWRLHKYGLKLNVDKTIIGAKMVQYLGYTLSGQGVTLSKDKLAAIKDFPMPTSPKAVWEFLGLANYFRSLIPRFSQTADPLNKSVDSLENWGTTAARDTGGLQQAQRSIDVSTDSGEPQQGGQVHTPNQRVDGIGRSRGWPFWYKSKRTKQKEWSHARQED